MLKSNYELQAFYWQVWLTSSVKQRLKLYLKVSVPTELDIKFAPTMLLKMPTTVADKMFRVLLFKRITV